MFPCVAGTKHPALAGGYLNASTDLGQIDAWWSDDDYNVAIVPGRAGWTVLDVDPKNGGPATLDALELCHGPCTDTFSHATPSGGAHFFFDGATGTNSAGRLGPGLDTRSERGYVLVPPSKTDAGSYRAARGGAMLPTPDWLVAALARRQHVTQAGEIGLDNPINVGRFEDYVMRQPPAPEGQRNETMTPLVGVACDMAISHELGSQIIYNLWGARCSPAMDPGEVERCGLWQSRQNTGHPLALSGPTSEVFKLPEDLAVTYERFYPFTLGELRGRPAPVWLLPEIIRERSIGHFFGATGSYKSYVTLLLAAQIGTAERPVVYVVGEGQDEMAARAAALETVLGREIHVRIVEDMPLVSLNGDMVGFIKVLKAHKLHPSLVVLDTLATALEGLDENTAKDMGSFVGAMKLVKAELNCAVVAIHHVGKDAARGERGSNALRAGVDFAAEIEGDDKLKTAKLTMRKQRGAAKRRKPFAFQGQRIGDELAFGEIELVEYDALYEADEDVTPQKVARAVARFNTYGEGLTTHALAMELVVPRQDTSEQEKALATAVAQLKHRAKRDLVGYCDGEGAALRWFATLAREPEHHGGGGG